MKRLIKKANQELNQKMIDDFKKENIEYNSFYYYQNYVQYGNIIHQVDFDLFFGHNDHKNDDTQQYAEVLRQEIQSNQLNNIKEIIESVIFHMIKTNSEIIHVKEDNLVFQFFDNDSYKSIRINFQNLSETFQGQGIQSIPYTFEFYKMEESEYFLNVTFCLEYQQSEEEHLNQQSKIKPIIQEHLKKIVHESDFVKDKFLNPQNKQIMLRDIYTVLTHIRIESSLKYQIHPLHISRYFTEEDFVKEFLDFFVQEIVEVLKNKLWNESNVVQKQMIRNFIKTHSDEYEQKG